MRDWIVGMQKAASESGPGIAPGEWASIEGAMGLVPPAELKDLYEAMDGARLPPDVRLFPWRGDGGESVIEQGRGNGGRVSGPGVIRFGVKGEGQPLFAARKSALASVGGLADWVAHVGDDEWLFGIDRNDAEVRVYRTLEELLSRLVPPVQTEEFGEVTYGRALNLVQGTLQKIEETAGGTTKAPAVAKKKAKPAKKAKAKAKAKAKPVKKKTKAKAKRVSTKAARRSKAGAKKKPARAKGRKPVKAKRPARRPVRKQKGKKARRR